MFDFEKYLQEQEIKEKARREMIAEQIKKGCEKCSQWDEYFGCCKCEGR